MRKRRTALKTIGEDGKVRYYYYKKKRCKRYGGGRPRCMYRIVLTRHNEQKGQIGMYASLEEMENARTELTRLNESVVMPSRTLSGKVRKDEYVILVKNIGDSDGVTKIRNEYGKIMSYRTNSDGWLIYDKFEALTECDFQVYGYNPHSGRKTMPWVFENLFERRWRNGYGLIRVTLYNNKILIKSDIDADLLILRDKPEAVSAYVAIHRRYAGHPDVLMMGSVSGHSGACSKVIDEIVSMTGWSRKKVFEIKSD